MQEFSFKNWLLNEASNVGDGSWALLYPTRAGDYPAASSEPLELRWLQKKWKIGDESSRPLYNIDLKSFDKIKYVVPKSVTMPDDKPWKHRPDNRPNIEVLTGQDLYKLAPNKKEKF